MQPQALSAKLVAAAAAGDKGTVDQALRDLGAARDEPHAEARSSLRMMRNVWRRRLRTSTLSYLQRQLLRETQLAPRDKQKKQTLQKVNKRIADRLDDLAALFGILYSFLFPAL